MDEPFLRATNKKDTGFAKTFAVLDHREKYMYWYSGCVPKGEK